MASKNDITGDKIQTKGILSKEGEENWDVIFGKKLKDSLNVNHTSNVDVETNTKDVNVLNTVTVQALKVDKSSRIDTTGQNKNDGVHYEYELNKSTGEVEKVNVKKLTDAFNGH